MAQDRSLHRQLESYIRARVAPTPDWLEESFTWPPKCLDLVHNPGLRGFQWLGVRIGAALRMLGIRPLIAEPFFSLADLEMEGFQVASTRHPFDFPDQTATGRYWIAEIVSPIRIVVCACAHRPPSVWHVLDEHVLKRLPATP